MFFSANAQCNEFITIFFLGLLTAQVLSLKEILGTEFLWPLLLAFTVVPTVFQLSVLPFLPESPRCLLIDKNEEDKARKGKDLIAKIKKVFSAMRWLDQFFTCRTCYTCKSRITWIRNRIEAVASIFFPKAFE